MSLAAGTELGPYRIVAKIGEGGMGEVYRATDTKLKREVALKILPDAFAKTADRLARFQREAEVLASLNHPNIASIYGLEDGDEVQALVMELVEGPTLADRLERRAGPAPGPAGRPGAQAAPGLPIDATLAIARQLVDALDAAHQRGIIHRDLKPANIKLRSDGTVKVLDFGLAKTMEAAAASNPSTDPAYTPFSQTPTMPSPYQSTAGAIVGTPSYMSPEQARGSAVDKRTDIWAFGCVLFELLSGRSAFPGPTATDVIAAIIARDPDWSQLPAETPPALARLLRRCLEKDPQRRLRDIGDATVDLDATPMPSVTQPIALAARGRVAVLSGAALLLGAAIGAATVWWTARPAATATATREPFEDAKFARLTDFPGSETLPAISPDGRFVAFLSDRDGQFDVWVSQVGTGRFTNLTKDMPPVTPNFVVKPIGFTANGSDIWFTQGARRVRMPITGGPPQPFLGTQSNNPSWSADGKRMVYANAVDGDPTFVADGTGANARQIFVDPAGTHNHNHVWSLDGQWIYFAHGIDVTQQMDIWRVRPTGEGREQLTQHPAPITSLAPIDSQTLVFVAAADDGSGPWLWRLDVESKVTRRVTSGLEQYVSVAATPNGRRLVATVDNPTATLWSVPIGQTTADESAVRAFAVPTVRALAPRFNGTSLFYLSARGTGDGLWRSQGGQSFEIWNGAAGALTEPAAISRDGSRVAISLRSDGKRRLAIMSADGSDQRFIGDSIETLGAADWSADGATVVVGGRDATGQGLFTVPANGGAPTRLVAGVATNPVLSPDGSVIVYMGPNVAGVHRLLGVTPQGSAVPLPMTATASARTQQAHRFLPTGRSLVYLQYPLDATTATINLLDLASQVTRVLAKFSSEGEIRTFDITPDGKAIVFDRLRQNSDVVVVDLPQ